MILQRIRIILVDTGFEPVTSAPEVWCATNEPPHLQARILPGILAGILARILAGIFAGIFFHKAAPICHMLAGAGGSYGIVSNRTNLKNYL